MNTHSASKLFTPVTIGPLTLCVTVPSVRRLLKACAREMLLPPCYSITIVLWPPEAWE